MWMKTKYSTREKIGNFFFSWFKRSKQSRILSSTLQNVIFYYFELRCLQDKTIQYIFSIINLLSASIIYTESFCSSCLLLHINFNYKKWLGGRLIKECKDQTVATAFYPLAKADPRWIAPIRERGLWTCPQSASPAHLNKANLSWNFSLKTFFFSLSYSYRRPKVIRYKDLQRTILRECDEQTFPYLPTVEIETSITI